MVDRAFAQGSERFESRGIGRETTPGCFVCGGSSALRNNIAAFVRSKKAGERVVAMFAQGARLDYQEYEPKWIQVKVGACNLHLPNLKRLHVLTLQQNDIIDSETIQTAIVA